MERILREGNSTKMGNLTKHITVAGGIGSCLCTFYFNGRANVMIIDDVKVEEAYRNLGIGTALIHKALQLAEAKNVDAVELLANKANTIAKKLYKKSGFKKTNKEHYRVIFNKIK